jgi:hypothetical protein
VVFVQAHREGVRCSRSREWSAGEPGLAAWLPGWLQPAVRSAEGAAGLVAVAVAAPGWRGGSGVRLVAEP